jgi:hypothetical protein
LISQKTSAHRLVQMEVYYEKPMINSVKLAVLDVLLALER